MITAKGKRELSTLPARGLHISKPYYRKIPTQKTRMPRTENLENSLLLYCGFETVLTDKVRANNHEYKIYKE